MSGAIHGELLLRGSACLRIGAASHRLERKAAALLCVLAVEGDTARGTLARWLWPEVDAAAARRNLRQRIFQLNRRVGCAVVAGGQQLHLSEDVVCDLAAAEPMASPAAERSEVLADFAYDELAEFSTWLAALRARLGGPALGARTLRADVREALTAMVGRLESILLADQAAGAAQSTSRKWASNRPARRSAK